MAKLLTIQPPLAGIVRSRGFQATPPFSCRESVNFWPQFAFDGSETLGIRPPLDDYATATGTVNLLARVNGTTSQTPQRTFVAGVAGALFRWNGTALVTVLGAGTIPSGRMAFAQAFEQKVYIPAVSPLVYNYPTDTLAAWTATAGTVPSDARIIVFWAGGLWVAAQPNTPHIVSGSATGDPLDWDFAAEGEGAAFSTIGDNAGLISDPVTALIPISGDSMIVSGPDSMQIWRGHPRRGGVADVLSHSVGVRGQGAWAQGPDGTIYAVTNKGFVAIQNGNAISPISEDRIPAELIGFTYDYLDPRINCAFDARFNGVHITVRDATSPEAWFYDLKNGGLFQIELLDYPFTMMRFDPAGTGRASEVLFGGVTTNYGGVSRYNLDGTESITNARIVIGPMKLTSNPTQRAKIKEANIVFGGGSDALAAEVGFYCGPTLDSSYAAATSGNTAAKHVTTVDRVFKAHGRIRPMAAGHGLSLVFDHSTAQNNPKLVFEEANLILEAAGRERAYVQHSDTTGPRAGGFIPSSVSMLAGLYAYYKLDEASGARNDSHTNLHHLTERGTVPAVVGKFDNGAKIPNFQPTDQDLRYVSSVPLATFDGSDGMTICFWVKKVAAGSSPQGGVSLNWDLSGGNNDFNCAVVHEAGGAESVQFDIGDGTLSNSANIDPDTKNVALDDGEWHLIVLYYDAASDIIGVGIDNKYTNTAATAAVNWVGASPEGLSISTLFPSGVDGANTDYAVDEVGLWGRVLDEAQRSALWNRGTGQTYPYS